MRAAAWTNSSSLQSRPIHNHHNHHSCFCLNWLHRPVVTRGTNPSGAAGGTSSARRRRERRQRSWWRHEQLSVAAALTSARHHSAGPVVVTRSEEQQEEVEHETYDGPRAQSTPPAGLRPGVLQDPGPPLVEAVTVGYVAAGVPLLSAPSLADSSAEVIDGSTLSFLLQRALEVKRKEEEAVEAAELVELEEKLAAAEEGLLRWSGRGPGSLVRLAPRSPALNSLPFTGSWPRMRWGRGG